jgi:hypothetical protein
VTLERLAYEEAQRAIDRQSDAVDGLRSRAGVLLAAISLATSFFGGLALRDGDLSGWAVAAAVVAVVFFIVAAGACVWVLWPHAEWAFNLSARLLGPHLERATDEATVYRELALRLERNYDANEKLLVRWRVGYHVGLYWLFRAGCITLAVKTFAWLVVLAL